MSAEGEPMRTVNIKDGYALQLAVKCGLHVAIITGGRSDAIRKRYEALGVKDIYMGASVKTKEYADLLARYDLKKAVCKYISHRNGGYGCGRDVIEQVLRAQGKWMSHADAFGW